ncbi:hypothetical protein SDC9_111497 [bioreactor metagenome]|uniref:Uncharacterized protein n=1 Tax=bioreactor metagenome TaxID=1076179 RepID=A0A645BGM4_9ZZZZ
MRSIKKCGGIIDTRRSIAKVPVHTVRSRIYIGIEKGGLIDAFCSVIDIGKIFL